VRVVGGLDLGLKVPDLVCGCGWHGEGISLIMVKTRVTFVVRDTRIHERFHGTCKAQAEVPWERSAGSCLPAIDLRE
jgi:hypothetical protein